MGASVIESAFFRGPSLASHYCLKLEEKGSVDVCSCGIEEFICKRHICFYWFVSCIVDVDILVIYN